MAVLVLHFIVDCCVHLNGVFLFQGPNASQLEKELAADQFPINEHFIGLVNVRNAMSVTLFVLGSLDTVK